MLRLIQSRPRSAKVFCIGVGNDVDKPLLEQLAQDAGGLASFLSHGDNFARQAQAFRRKLTRPAAVGVQVDFGGLKVFDVEPKALPNLYHGAPLRLYGRYQGGGEAQVSLRAGINGVELKKSEKLEFPKQDLENPEIDRMWASHRVDALLKQANRSGSRNEVVSEIVKLGEGYSIVTEYTSFLVLENDAEFQRWKIARANAVRTDHDRKAQELVRARLEAIRNKAVAGLGPQTETQLASLKPMAPAAAALPAPSNASGPPSPASTSARPGRGFDVGSGGGGSGPVGPLFVGLLLVLRRLRNKRS